MFSKIYFTFSLSLVGLFFASFAYANSSPDWTSQVEEACKKTKPSTPATEPCRARSLNFLEVTPTGKTLFVEGQTERQLYDILIEDRTINRIELNSYGGREMHSDILAELIRKRGITTSVREGAICASLCALVYQAGVKREAHVTAIFGYHGMQLLSLQQMYEMKCVEVSARNKRAREQFCEEFRNNWIAECRTRTDGYHALIEQLGASPALYADFKNRPHDPEWEESGNCATVMPWELQAEEAVKYNIVLELKR